LGGERGDKDNGQNRDDHGKAIVDGKMSHDGGLPDRSERSGTVSRYRLKLC
jgi:hypothetical protein